MLYELKALIGSPVIATDGETGSVRTFLFDDQSWKVSCLVVDVGGWLKRRDVVLPVAALEQPNWANKPCCARLTRKQLHDSPVLDTEKPVSRQQEIAMREYWGPLACWVNDEIFLSSIPAGAKYPVHTVEDSHLRLSLIHISICRRRYSRLHSWRTRLLRQCLELLRISKVKMS